MPRLVYRDTLGPIKIDPKALDPEKPIFICACGLSQTRPYCDGSHKACRAAEKPDVLYVYGRDNKTVVEERPVSDASL
jgi:CDGSH-type Zn-finger protein